MAGIRPPRDGDARAEIQYLAHGAGIHAKILSAHGRSREKVAQRSGTFGAISAKRLQLLSPRDACLHRARLITSQLIKPRTDCLDRRPICAIMKIAISCGCHVFLFKGSFLRSFASAVLLL